VEQDDELKGTITIKENASNKRFLDVGISFDTQGKHLEKMFYLK
jgi:hypothetical protein